MPMTPPESVPTVLWRPDEARLSRAHLTDFTRWLAETRGLRFDGYEALWRWSTELLEDFWASLWDYFDIRASQPYERVLVERRMPGARWFEGARLNYAEHLLARGEDADAADRPALVFRSETVSQRTLTWAELRAQVGALMATLRSHGVTPGDRACAYMPNIPETAIAAMATGL